MRSYLVPAAGAAAAAIAVAAILLVTSPWSSEGSATLQGDVDCNQEIEALDALFGLRFIAGIEPFADCVEEAGDTDCNGAIEALDALHILRHIAGLESLTPEDCPPVGTLIDGGPTPEPTDTPTPTPDATPTPTPTPTPTAPTPTSTPSPSACTGEPSGISGPSGDGYALTPAIQATGHLNRIIGLAEIPGTNGRDGVIITQHGLLFQVCLDGPGTSLPFGDISERVNCCGEQGLLSIAFSPDYETDNSLYLYYTRSDSPNTVCGGDDDLIKQCSFIGRFTVTNDEIAWPPDVVLRVDQPAGNHNGGQLLFDDDGYLYLGLGDGGGQRDAFDNGQNINTMLGSIIRIDVSGGGPGYDPHPDNPFFGSPGRDEIYAYGLRNPWRMSFDRETGDLWVGDVGDGFWEEVDLVHLGGNYGWPCYEGEMEGPGSDRCEGTSADDFEFPRAVYPIYQQPDCAIIGGYVYRGSAMPQLEGWYIFADYCTGIVRAIDTTVDDPEIVVLIDSPYNPLSLAELPNGEILMLTQDDGIYLLVSN